MLGKHITENLFLIFVVIAHEYVDTWAGKLAKHVGTWARKHAKHVGTWARKVRNLADSISTVINVILEITDLKHGLLSNHLF